jgi:YHS domain-containing protein
MEAMPLFLLIAAICFSALIGGAAREGHGDRTHNDRTAPPAFAADPVCGMAVAPDEAYTKRHAGHTYHLCSKKCLDLFEVNPEAYRVAP